MFNPFTQLIRRFRGAENVHCARSSELPYLLLADGTRLPMEEALLAEYFHATEDLDTPSLNAMDTRSPSHRNIIAYLLDMGHTPATVEDITEAYLALHDHLPGEFELRTTIDQVRQFGMVEENQHS